MPPTLTGKIQYTPSLPPVREQLNQRIYMGSALKCLITYEKPFWRDRGFSGEVVSSQGPLCVTYDNMSHDHQACLVGFINGAQARYWAAQSKETRRRAVLSKLEQYFGTEATTPLDYIEQDWSAEPWSHGGPVAIMPPGVLTTFGSALHTPFGRIHWTGTETAMVWTGFMDGAIRAGQKAAQDVEYRLA